VVLEEADDKVLDWLLRSLESTSANSYTNRYLYSNLNERCQDVLSQDTKEGLSCVFYDFIYSSAVTYKN